MSLREEQCKFTKDVNKLFTWAFSMGYEITLGEAFRTPEQQAIYFNSGRSKTMNSKHLQRCAIDLFVFKDGKLLTTKEEMQPIGNAWEGLSKENEWGGNWGFCDTPHFQRNV